MRLLQNGPTVDALLKVLTPPGYKKHAWGEGVSSVPVWEDLEPATYLLTLISDVLRADARMFDKMIGRKCVQLVKPLFQFIIYAGDRIRHGRQQRGHVPAQDEAAYLLTKVLVRGGPMEPEVVRELARIHGSTDPRIHGFTDSRFHSPTDSDFAPLYHHRTLTKNDSVKSTDWRATDLMIGALKKLMKRPEYGELMERMPGIYLLDGMNGTDPAGVE